MTDRRTRSAARQAGEARQYVLRTAIRSKVRITAELSEMQTHSYRFLRTRKPERRMDNWTNYPSSAAVFSFAEAQALQSKWQGIHASMGLPTIIHEIIATDDPDLVPSR